MVTFPLSSTVDMTMFLQLLYSIACTKRETLFISSQLQRKQYLSAQSYRESTICQLSVTEKAQFVSSLLQRKHYLSAHCYRENTICQLTITEKALFVSSLLQRKHYLSAHCYRESTICQLTVIEKALQLHVCLQQNHPPYSIYEAPSAYVLIDLLYCTSHTQTFTVLSFSGKRISSHSSLKHLQMFF